MPSSACKKSALRSEEHTSELQSNDNLVCRLLLEKKQLPEVALAGRPCFLLRGPSAPTEQGDEGVNFRRNLAAALPAFFFKYRATTDSSPLPPRPAFPA